MRVLRAWLHRLSGVFGSSRRDRDLRAELDAHLQLHIDDNIRAGMTPAEARRAAILNFGPVEAIKEEYRDRASIRVVEILRQDLSYAVRRMAMQPGFTLLVVLTLALGMGANAAMWGFVDALLFRKPPHVEQPGQLVVFENAGNYPRRRCGRDSRRRAPRVRRAGGARRARRSGGGVEGGVAC